MKAARLHGAGDLRVADEPAPVPGPGESLVRVTAVGICGSDLHWFAEGGIGDARLDRPLVIGHEFAGVIEGGPADGRRVAVDPALPCNACPTCLTGDHNLCPTTGFAGHGAQDGALREYLAWPTALLHPLPDGLSDADGALLEPLGVALHALGRAHLRHGYRVAVVGCGPIGLLLVGLARFAGAASVVAVDPLPHRRAAALRYGASTAHDASVDLAEAGVDVAFEVAGTDEAIETCLQAVRPGARVVLVGIPDGDRSAFPAALARRKGLTLVLSRRMNHTYDQAIKLVDKGVVDLAGLVTDRYPLAAAAEAIASAAARTGLKTVVEVS